MRQLLVYKPLNLSFSSTTIRNLLKNKSADIQHYDANKTLQFQKHLRNLIYAQENHQSSIQNKLHRRYERLVMTASRPVQTILRQFLIKSQIYSEEVLTSTVVNVSRAFQLSRIDHDGHLDSFGYKLYGSQQWQNFMDEIKFGFSEYSYISMENMIIIVNSLTKMGYLDVEVIKLAISRIQNQLNIPIEERIFQKYESQDWKRYYQLDKKKYYQSNRINVERKLLQSQEFLNNLKFFEGKRNQLIKRRKNIDLIPSQDFENEEDYKNVINLLDNLNNFLDSAGKMVESVITLRKQYAKMCSISANQKVLRSPELNNELLEIQQKLLQLNLITIHDIKNPEKILDTSENAVYKQTQNCEFILKQVLEKFKILPYENFVSYFSQNLNEKQGNISEGMMKSVKQQQLAQLLSALARYVNIEHVLYGTRDKISMLNAKWQKYFTKGNIINDKLPVERIFRKAYAEYYSFIMKNEPLLQFEFFQSKLKTKVYWFDTMLQLGIYKDLFIQFTNTTISPDLINKQLNDKDFTCFINLLNCLYPLLNNSETKFQIKAQNHQAIMKRLVKISQLDDQSWITYKQLNGIINYMYQNGFNKGQYSELYRNFVSNLANEVRDLDEAFDNSSDLQVSFNILLLENTNNLESTSNYQSIMKTLEGNNEENQYCNPFLKTVNEIARRLSKTQGPSVFGEALSFIPSGYNYKTDSVRALYITQSNHSSLDQISIPNGNINAYCMRIKQKFNVEVQPIGINKFLQISYFTEDYVYQPLIKLKKVEEIMSILEEKLDEGNTRIKRFMNNLMESFVKVIEQQDKFDKLTPHNGFKVKTNKIINTMKKINEIISRQKNCLTPEQARINQYELYITFDLEFKTDFNNLTPDQGNYLQKQFKQLQQNNEISIFQEIKAISEDIIVKSNQAINNKQQESLQEQLTAFIGKRLTIDCLLENKVEGIVAQPEIQLINQSYCLDQRYIQYRDWNRKVREISNFENLSVGDKQQSSVIKFLALKYLPNFKEYLIDLPTINNQMLTPSYPLNWQNVYLSNNNNSKENTEFNKQIQKVTAMAKQVKNKQQILKSKSHSELTELNYIMHLQNLKHQLKISKTPQEICDYIIKFDFIDRLLDEHLQTVPENPETHFIQRNPDCYFEYQNEKSLNKYMESPYMEYIFDKMGEIEGLKDAQKERKLKKSLLYQKFSLGEIDKHQYFCQVKQYDLEIISLMKEKLSKKIIGQNFRGHKNILTEPSKLIQFKKDLNELERAMSKNNFYSVQVDDDYVVSNGNMQQTLKLKRGRAQVNLILYRIMYRSAKGEQLSEKQQKFMKKWSSNLLTNIKSNRTTVYPSYSSCPLKKLSLNDKSRLTLQHTNFMKHCGDLALNELILEFHNFFDESSIIELQKQVIVKRYSQNLPQEKLQKILQNSRNKLQQYYSHRMEEHIMSKCSQLDSVQIEDLVKMTKLHKTQGNSSRTRYQQFYKDLIDNIHYINNLKNVEFRNVALSQYLRLKDWQFYNKYNPEDIQQLKKSEGQKIWSSVFKKDRKETTTPEIKKKVDELCKRMILLKKSVPAYFSYLILGILEHEKTSVFCKEKLLGYCLKYAIPIEIDSEDVINIIKFHKQTPKQLQSEYEELKQEIKKISQHKNQKIISGIL